MSSKLKPFSTFHHLYVLYKDGSKEPNFERTIKYIEADVPKKELQEFYKIEIENEIENEKKNEKKKN